MWNRKKSVELSIVVCFIVAFMVTAGVFFGPWAFKMWMFVYRGLQKDGEAIRNIVTVFSACFYPCAVITYVALYNLLKLLYNIKNDNIFILNNVKHLRVISWCCFAVGFITLIGGILYLPFLFVAVAASFVGLMLRIVKNVMQAAVEISEENELTI